MNILNYFIDFYNRCPGTIRIAYLLNVVFFISIIIFIFRLTYLRLSLRLYQKIEARYQAKYEQYLISYLYSEEEENKLSPKQKKIIDLFKGIIKKPYKRKIVISTLLKLKNEISGEMEESIDKLYFHSGLINYSFACLRSGNWYIVANGIRELTLFNVKRAQKIVLGNINHPKKEVRKEMQLYLVNLFHFKGLEFLNSLETPLSEWDQIQLLEIVKKINTHETFEIIPWLKSTNESVVIFALRLAKIFNLFEIKDELIDLLEHPDKKIRLEVISLLNHFFIIEAKDILKVSFTNRSPEEQTAIFKMLENLSDSDDENILSENINHDNFEIKILARKILRNLNLEKFKLSHTEVAMAINPQINCFL